MDVTSDVTSSESPTEQTADSPADHADQADQPVLRLAEPSADTQPVASPEADDVDVLDAAGVSVFKRVLPIAGVAVLMFVLRRLLRSRS